MSSAIGPGDWVECIGYDLGGLGFEVGGQKPKRGHIYQVEDVVQGRLRDGTTAPALRLVGWHVLSERGNRVVYSPDGFRPIYRPKSSIIEQLKQPISEPVRELLSID